VAKEKTSVTFLLFYPKSTTFGSPVEYKQQQDEKVRYNYILFSIISPFFLLRRQEGNNQRQCRYAT
jgi:hypothetical protein